MVWDRITELTKCSLAPARATNSAGVSTCGLSWRPRRSPTPASSSEKLAKADVADDQKIDIAFRVSRSRSHRSEHQRAADPLIGQRFGQHIGQPSGLQHELADVARQGMPLICRVVDPVAVLAAGEKADFHEFFDVLTHGADGETGPTLNLPQMDLAGAEPEQHAEDFRSRPRTDQLRQEVHLFDYTIHLYGLAIQSPASLRNLGFAVQRFNWPSGPSEHN